MRETRAEGQWRKKQREKVDLIIKSGNEKQKDQDEEQRQELGEKISLQALIKTQCRSRAGLNMTLI